MFPARAAEGADFGVEADHVETARQADVLFAIHVYPREKP
jgi:hypothetical protein